MMKGISSGYKWSGSLLSLEEQLAYHNNRKEAGKGDGHCAAYMFGTLDWRQAHWCWSGCADGRLVLTSLKRVMSLNEMVSMTPKLEKKQNRFFKLDFFKETLVLLSAKLHLGYRKSVYKKSLWQLRVPIHRVLCVQTKLGLIILTLCLYCALI